MADTVSVGGVNYSTDDITNLNGATVTAGTNQTQRIKVQYGDDGTARDVSAAFPLPVTVAATTTATTGTASGNIWRTRVAPSTVISSTALQAAPGAGLSIYLTDVSVGNSGSALNLVSFLDGATAILDIPAAASGGGGSLNLQTPIKLTANTALNYTTSAAQQTYVTVVGFIAP